MLVNHAWWAAWRLGKDGLGCFFFLLFFSLFLPFSFRFLTKRKQKIILVEWCTVGDATQLSWRLFQRQKFKVPSTVPMIWSSEGRGVFVSRTKPSWPA